MGLPIINSVCCLSLHSCAIAIGAVQSVIYGGVFFWWYVSSVVFLSGMHMSPQYIIKELTIQEMTNGSNLLCCLFNVALIYGVRKSESGFILTWLLNQVVWISSSLLTLLYYLAVPYLRISPEQAFFEVIINVIQGFCLLVIYSHYARLREGNSNMVETTVT